MYDGNKQHLLSEKNETMNTDAIRDWMCMHTWKYRERENNFDNVLVYAEVHEGHSLSSGLVVKRLITDSSSLNSAVYICRSSASDSEDGGGEGKGYENEDGESSEEDDEDGEEDEDEEVLFCVCLGGLMGLGELGMHVITADEGPGVMAEGDSVSVNAEATTRVLPECCPVVITLIGIELDGMLIGCRCSRKRWSGEVAGEWVFDFVSGCCSDDCVSASVCVICTGS